MSYLHFQTRRRLNTLDFRKGKSWFNFHLELNESETLYF